MISQTQKTYGGVHAETSIFRNVLAEQGHDWSEALVLGIGGGVGAGYFVMEYCDQAGVAIGARHYWQDSLSFYEGLAARLGAGIEVKHTSGAKSAVKNLRDVLETGRSAILWVDRASLPYYAIAPEYKKAYWHIVGVRGLTEQGGVLVDDRAPVPYELSMDVLTEARTILTTAKTRLLALTGVPQEIDLVRAVRAGIHACWHSLLHPKIKNFGVAAWEKWAELLVHPKDKKAWLHVFNTAPKLYWAQTHVYASIETFGTGGGLMRGLYADFLDEAAAILSEPRLQEAAQRYRELAAKWTSLAHAVMPGNVPLLREARELMERQNELLCTQGPSAADEVEAIAESLRANRERALTEYPIDQDDLPAYYRQLHDHVIGLYEAERSAVLLLQEIVPSLD